MTPTRPWRSSTPSRPWKRSTLASAIGELELDPSSAMEELDPGPARQRFPNLATSPNPPCPFTPPTPAIELPTRSTPAGTHSPGQGAQEPLGRPPLAAATAPAPPHLSSSHVGLEQPRVIFPISAFTTLHRGARGGGGAPARGQRGWLRGDGGAGAGAQDDERSGVWSLETTRGEGDAIPSNTEGLGSVLLQGRAR